MMVNVDLLVFQTRQYLADAHSLSTACASEKLARCIHTQQLLNFVLMVLLWDLISFNGNNDGSLRFRRWIRCVSQKQFNCQVFELVLLSFERHERLSNRRKTEIMFIQHNVMD